MTHHVYIYIVFSFVLLVVFFNRPFTLSSLREEFSSKLVKASSRGYGKFWPGSRAEWEAGACENCCYKTVLQPLVLPALLMAPLGDVPPDVLFLMQGHPDLGGLSLQGDRSVLLGKRWPCSCSLGFWLCLGAWICTGKRCSSPFSPTKIYRSKMGLYWCWGRGEHSFSPFPIQLPLPIP